MRVSLLIVVLIASGKSAIAQPDINALVNTLRNSPQDALRENAAHTLGQIALILGPVQAAPALPALLDAFRTDRAPAVRREASIAVTSIGTSKPIIPFYIIAMRTVSNIDSFVAARVVVTNYVQTASEQDIQDLKILDNLRAFRDSLFSLPRAVGFQRLNDISALLRLDCQRAPSDRPALIADFRQGIERFSADPVGQATVPFNVDIGSLALCSPDSVKVLLDVTPLLPFDDRITSLVALDPVFPSLPPDVIQQERSKVLNLAMDVLNTFPNTWKCQFAVALPTFNVLGSFASPATAKLRLLAALSERDSTARFHFPVCGQAEARNALQAIGQ